MAEIAATTCDNKINKCTFDLTSLVQSSTPLIEFGGEKVKFDSGSEDLTRTSAQKRKAKPPTINAKRNNNLSPTSTSEKPVINLENAFEDSARLKKDIFNPFNRKTLASTPAPSETKEMKHDYRKDATASGARNSARGSLDWQKTYLFIYNVILFVVFLKVNLILIIKGVSGTTDDDSIKGSALIIKILTYIQLLETVHPMLGLVPGGPMMPFLQTMGRLIVNSFLSEPNIRISSAPFAQYLFIVWTSIEIFRYSFYALRVFKIDAYPITWCRYTLFIPLYPLGGLFESMVIASAIKYFEKTGDYSVTLPNAANFSFNLPTFLKIYIFFIVGPSIYSLMKYMWSQRCKQLKEKVE